MVRDNLKDVNYFLNHINNQFSRIKKFEDALKSGSVTEDRIFPIEKKTFNIRKTVLIAHYSSGEDLESIKESQKEIINKMSLYWKASSGYIDLIWMLSIGILLEVEDETFSKLVKMVKNDNPNDYLVDFLINYNDKDWPIKNRNFMFEKPYGFLKNVIEENDKNEALNKLTEYLKKVWYKGHSSAGWHNNHNSKHDTYFGYWSFESGAIAKILGLDDSSLKDQPYYPYDMVHFND